MKTQSISITEANDRIAALSKNAWVETHSGPENLDAPIDPAIRVTSTPTSHKIELVINDVAVSWTTIFDFQQQIGHGVVRTAGIADVRTHDDHRFKGYSRRVMENAIRVMRQYGFDMALLFGIPAFYPKYGYAPAYPVPHFSMPVRHAETPQANGYEIVPYEPRHLSAVLKMYHENNRGRTGPWRRDPKLWKVFRKGLGYKTKSIVKVLLDAKQKTVGYFVCDDSNLTATFIEVGYATMAVFPDILRAMAEYAWSQRLENIKMVLPEDHEFIDYCKPRGLSMEKSWRKDGGPMIRLVNIPSTFTKISDDLAARMRQAGSLNIRTNLDSVNLSWQSGKMRVGPAERKGASVQLPQWALAQLIHGYRKASSFAGEGILKGNAQALEILEEMFPVHPHFHYAVDQF